MSVDTETLTRTRRQMAVLHRAANHHVIDANCLVRSMVGYDLLRRQGLRPTLRIGVARAGAGELAAHAWLELAGEVINDAPDVATRFAPLGNASELPGAMSSWS